MSSVHCPASRRERAAADHVGDRLERPGRLELERRADRVARRETQQRAHRPVDHFLAPHASILEADNAGNGQNRNVSQLATLRVHNCNKFGERWRGSGLGDLQA